MFRSCAALRRRPRFFSQSFHYHLPLHVVERNGFLHILLGRLELLLALGRGGIGDGESHVRTVIRHRTPLYLRHGHILPRALRLLPVHQFLQFGDVVAQVEQDFIEQFALVLEAVRLFPLVERHDVVRHGVVRNVFGKDFRSDDPLGERMEICSATFFSCLMLPGHE